MARDSDVSHLALESREDQYERDRSTHYRSGGAGEGTAASVCLRTIAVFERNPRPFPASPLGRVNEPLVLGIRLPRVSLHGAETE